MAVMNFCEIKEGLHIVGIEGGIVTRKAVAYLESKGQQVALYNAQEATIAMPLLVTRSNVLPLALDAGYDKAELLDLLHAVMRCGMRLMPIGDTAVWEEMVPLELPELAANLVYPVDSDWFISEPDDSEAGTDSAERTEADYYGIMDINGTSVSIHMPDLTTPLADLNVAAVLPPPVVPAQPKKPEKNSSSKKQNRHIAVIALLSVMLVTAVIVIYSVLIQNAPTGAPSQASPSSNQSLPVARPVRVWLNNCHYCRERLSLTEQGLTNLILVLKSIKKIHSAGDTMNDMMLKVATSVNNGGLTCHKCKKLKATLNNIHGLWHRPESGKWVLDWKLARVGNAAYKKIQVGEKLGCYSCKESLNEELVKHACPNDNAKSEAFKPGAGIDCAYCQEMLKKKLLEEHECPPDNNRAKLAEGEKLGCEKCAKRKTHECPNPNTREGLQAGADISCPLCQKKLKALLQHVCPKNDHETELKKGTDLGCEQCAKRYAKIQKIKNIAAQNQMRIRQESNADVHTHLPSTPDAPKRPQSQESETDKKNKEIIKIIDGQKCPTNSEVKAGKREKIKILRNHANKGCARCMENLNWWLSQQK